MESSKILIQKQLTEEDIDGSDDIVLINDDEDDELSLPDNLPLPFVKWVGGKRSLLKELSSHLPEKFDTYYEPFVGGGALFFAIHKQLKNAFLSDINLDLVITYKAIQKEPQKLIEILNKHSVNHSKDYYYKIRGSHNLWNPLEVAARLIYLNRTCYNGLYRVNRTGHFNVPMGSYKNPSIINEKNIMACSEALKNVKIEMKAFDSIRPKAGDLVYFDPPYHPTDEISFTSYTKLDFTEKDQVNLRDFAVSLHKKGVKVMLSNSHTSFIKDLYKSSIFKIHVVKAPRFVNCKKDKRNPVEEVIITNY
jgi:DNA adenine methylase